MKLILKSLTVGAFICLATSATYAANWSDTSLAVSYGKDFSEPFKNDAQGDAIDIEKYHVDTFVMGNDWEGKFDELKEICEVIYLDRTPEISTSKIKADLK